MIADHGSHVRPRTGSANISKTVVM